MPHCISSLLVEKASSEWEEYYLELDTLARYFLSNLPDGDYEERIQNEWPKLTHAIRQMSRESFFDFCSDIGEEICRRNNDLRDGMLCLPLYDNLPLGRNYTRRKISSLSPQRFHLLCFNACSEISRRCYRTPKPLKKNSLPFVHDLCTKPVVSSLSIEQTLVEDSWYSYTEFCSAKELAQLLDNLYEESIPEYPDLQHSYLQKSSQDQFSAMMSTIYSVFVSMLRDKEQSAIILNCSGDPAQQLLDLMQMLLDYPKADAAAKNSLLTALLRLTWNSGLHPRRFILSGVKYEKLLVASGAFGDIWKGEFEGQPVCLKIVRLYQNSDRERWLKAFSREAILWGQISHPNILPFYGVYHLEDEYGRLCLVSSWMNRGNLNEYLQQEPDANRHLLVFDVACGLAYLHTENIVHGDLKGANILITNSGRACLSDFGQSTVLNPDLFSPTSQKSSSLLQGTIRWQAPELVNPDVEDPKLTTESDVYAYGCVLYETYTGQVPFYEFSRDISVIFHIIKGRRPSLPPPDSISFSQFMLTKKLCSIMENCWNPEPSKRPSMQEIFLNLGTENIKDTRVWDDWEKYSASRFRNAVYRSDSLSTSVLETVLSWL